MKLQTGYKRAAELADLVKGHSVLAEQLILQRSRDIESAKARLKWAKVNENRMKELNHLHSWELKQLLDSGWLRGSEETLVRQRLRGLLVTQRKEAEKASIRKELWGALDGLSLKKGGRQWA